jgi:hypothetical protein
VNVARLRTGVGVLLGKASSVVSEGNKLLRTTYGACARIVLSVYCFSFCHRQRQIMLTVLDRLTFKKRKKSSFFRGPVLHSTLEHNRTDHIKCVVSPYLPLSQPGVVSQISEAYARGEQIGASVREL